MKKIIIIIALVIGVIIIIGLNFYKDDKEINNIDQFSASTKVDDVINNASFQGFGNLLFPVDRVIDTNTTLDKLDNIYIWYNYIDTNTTVEILNYLKDTVDSGKDIFYPIYTEEEMTENPDLRNTGLFFFRGNEFAKTAIINAGGGFMYVATMQDSFPQALEISKQGYNAFALIYRPSADTAMEDLARAVSYLHENAEELKVDMCDYSVWGGSAGARMAAWLGSFGTKAFGEKEYPRPAAVIMQYTGLSEVTGNEPPTYSCVGTNDYIANYLNMQKRTQDILANGTDAEIEIFEGLPHGFGLGIGTVAEGWINNAIHFWEKHMND